jgi:hypothetical protein
LATALGAFQFDKVTGDRAAWSIFGDIEATIGFLVFPDIITAAAYLIHEVLPHDERTRLNGYRLGHGGGAPGTHDPDREARITVSVTSAIRKTLFDALTNGYRPEHGLHLRRLMKDATVTFEVTEAGYFGDLVFFGLADGTEVWDRLDLEKENELKRKKKLMATRKAIVERIETSPDVVARLRKSLGDAYDLAAPDSIVIAASMLAEFDRTGDQPGYDYSGISMKASKLIEREMKRRVFVAWRDAARRNFDKPTLKDLRAQIEAEHTGRTGQVLIDWLQKRSKIDLGSMRYCLKELEKKCAATPLLRSLADYLRGFQGVDWLTSDEFGRTLEDVTTKYRNGGVHEHLVNYDVCCEAVERVLLGPKPTLQLLLQATERSEQQ